MKVPDLEVKKTLYVGIGDPTLTLGKGLTQVRGGAYLEGPAVFGAPPPFTVANVAIAKLKNSDVIQPPFIPGAIAGFNHSPYSLAAARYFSSWYNFCILSNLYPPILEGFTFLPVVHKM